MNTKSALENLAGRRHKARVQSHDIGDCRGNNAMSKKSGDNAPLMDHNNLEDNVMFYLFFYLIVSHPYFIYGREVQVIKLNKTYRTKGKEERHCETTRKKPLSMVQCGFPSLSVFITFLCCTFFFACFSDGLVVGSQENGDVNTTEIYMACVCMRVFSLKDHH